MTPGALNLALYRGDSYAWLVMVWQDVDKTEPVDLAGAVAAAQIRDRSGGAKQVDMACTITAPNIIDMTLSADDCGGAPAGRWDLQVTFPDGDVRTLLAGTVKVTDDITDSDRP